MTTRYAQFHLITWLMPKGHFFNTQVCQSSCLPWALVQKFLFRWIISLKCCYFERCFFWSSRFFCNVGEMKWSFTKVIYRHARTITWRSHRLHFEVEIVQSNSSCQRSESDINGNAQFTRLQVWMLYQNTHVNLVLHSIFARKRNVPTHSRPSTARS